MTREEYADVLELLNFSHRERIVFSALTEKSRSPADIQKETQLPRMTLEHVLKKIQSRGLARPVTIGARTRWKRAPLTSIYKRINKLKTFVKPDTSYEETLSQNSVWNDDTLDISVIRGVNKILNTHSHAYMTKSSERFLLTQFADALRILLADTEKIRMTTHSTQLANATQNIVELIASEHAEDVWYASAADKTFAQETIKRIVDASVVTHDVFPDNLPAEMFIFHDTVTLTDWEEEVSVVIHNKHIARMLRGFFKAAKIHGTPFNPNTIFLKRLEEEKKKSNPSNL